MSTFARWCRFNAVGALGMFFQLGVLAALNRVAPGHYLAATTAAIELTLLHNFIWHLHYTWPDDTCPDCTCPARREARAILRRLVRFHVSNGLVSMTGNLALMRLLVQEARLPVLVANGIAILICSLLNFWLGHYWAFAGGSHRGQPGLCHPQRSEGPALPVPGAPGPGSPRTGPCSWGGGLDFETWEIR